MFAKESLSCLARVCEAASCRRLKFCSSCKKLKLQDRNSIVGVEVATSRKQYQSLGSYLKEDIVGGWLGVWNVCWLWSFGLGSLFCKQILKKERSIFLGFPLGGVFP